MFLNTRVKRRVNETSRTLEAKQCDANHRARSRQGLSLIRDFSRKRVSHGTPCCFSTFPDRNSFWRGNVARYPDGVGRIKPESEFESARKAERRQRHRRAQCRAAGVAPGPAMSGLSWSRKTT